MKLTTKLIAGTAALAFLTMVAGSLQAQVTNVISISILASAQGDASTNGSIVTVKPPSKHSFGTKDILVLLAVAEHAAGNYAAGTNFPSGAKLVVVSGDNSGDFQVLTKTNTLLVDVTNIISVTDGVLGNDITSGKYSNSGPGATSETDLHVLTIQYDDTGILGADAGVKLYMTGLMTNKKIDTAPKSGFYSETQSAKLSSGVGEGVYQGFPFVLTGNLSANGKATLPAVF